MLLIELMTNTDRILDTHLSVHLDLPGSPVCPALHNSNSAHQSFFRKELMIRNQLAKLNFTENDTENF